MLRALADDAGNGTRLARVAEMTGLGKTTVLRLLKALQKVSGESVLAPEGWEEGKPTLHLPADGPDEKGADWFCRFAKSS